MRDEVEDSLDWILWLVSGLVGLLCMGFQLTKYPRERTASVVMARICRASSAATVLTRSSMTVVSCLSSERVGRLKYRREKLSRWESGWAYK